MNTKLLKLCMVLLTLCLATAAWAGDSLQIKLKDGSTWRGQLTDAVEVTFKDGGVPVTITGKILKAADDFITVEGTIAGIARTRTIYKSDIVSMKTTSAAAPAVDAPVPANSANPKDEQTRTTSVSDASGTAKPADPAKKPLGVFVLPLEGGVGETFRHDEIKALADYVDKNYGPGQIIVLIIDSNGGASAEVERIYDTIHEIKKKHRVVAWLKKAISAASETSMCCNEIYFMTEGVCGSNTTWNMGNGQAVRGELLDKLLEETTRHSEECGYSRHVALAMKINRFECSYDKDPDTGKVTFYGDMSGKYPLSDKDQNLCFNATQARHCGFSKGTADTTEQMAKLLDLPEWKELSDYGRKLAADWQSTIKRAEQEIPLLVAKYNRGGGALTQEEAIGLRIRIVTQLQTWHDRCPVVAEKFGVPPREQLDRDLAELRRQLANMKKR